MWTKNKLQQNIEIRQYTNTSGRAEGQLEYKLLDLKANLIIPYRQS